ncbi:MAG: TIM barrel protein, partial [Candidatus Omnitrophica bacterium]|nr:TIM barrel protein [Candidatus Omnitrophota bacterium]
MPLSLSTSWNASRVKNAQELIFEIKELKFHQVELSFNLNRMMLRQIKTFVKKKGIVVSSVHNFCPVPAGVARLKALPDHYSMSSLDERARKKAVAATKVSIDTAKELSAKAVVLHCGRVEIADQTRKLVSLYASGKKNTQEFKRLKACALKERASLAKPYFAQTLKSLEELNNYAHKRNILLGIETRFYIREIPSFTEIEAILKNFPASNIFYWHDTGHAQLMQNLGIAKHLDFLKAYSSRMLGVHLHNIMGCADHQAPLKGDLDFKRLLPYLKKATLKVIEAHRQASGQDLIEGKAFLEKLF